MNRLLVVLALLFGFAAVAGPAMASAKLHAPAIETLAAAAPAVACADVQSVAPKLVPRPCAKINKVGMAMPCHQFSAVLPVASALDEVGLGRPEPEWVSMRALNVPGEPQFRPPRGNAHA